MVVRKYDEKGNRIIKESKKKGKLLKKKEIDKARYPAEVELFIYRYKIDIKKVNFRAMLKILALVCSIDISLIVSILSFLKIENTIILLLIGALLVFPVILISFSLLGKYFKKKGLTKHV